MKIAFLSTIAGHSWGGADFMWTRAAEAAAERGDQLLLVLASATMAHPRIEALARRGATLCVQPPPAPRASLATRVLHRLWHRPPPPDVVIPALAKFRPDLVAFSCGATYDLAYFPAWTRWLAETRTPFHLIANWQMEQPVLPPAETAAIRELFPAARLLAFVSTRNLASTRQHLQLALPNARVLHNPLRWQPSDTCPWLESAVPRLATVSRLDESKGIHLLLQALAQLPTGSGPWQLDIHGSGPQEATLRDLAARLGISERVAFRGHVSALSTIWAGNQLLCSPAIEEGVPMTIPEAMLCGRPVLATRVGGAEDWLVEGRTGFLCATPAVPQLTATLVTALAAHARWSQFGQEAASTARRLYRPDDFLQLLAPSP